LAQTRVGARFENSGIRVNGALHRLKNETADLHVAAERHVRILDADATEATYARYLAKMLGFHAPIEMAFARHAGLEAAGFAAMQRKKRAWLVADLEALGVAAAPPACPDVPDLGDLARASGIAYVIEGSMLGGKFILAKMGPSLAHVLGRATRFLEGYRADTGALWKQFGALVERVLYDDAAIDRAITGARDTFARLIVWLDEPAAEPPHPRKFAKVDA
jgi:heme oxygenase (biliverdin-IX-beta and delta-forming)